MSDDQTAQAPLAYRAVRGGLWVALSSYFNILFGFLANLALTRILEPRDFGVFALAMFFISLINLRPKLSASYAFGQRKQATGELIGTHLVLDAGAGAATLVIAIAAVPLLRFLGYSVDVAWVVIALACVEVFNGIASTAWVLLDRELKFEQTSILSSLIFPVSYIPAFLLAFSAGSYWSLVAQNATYGFMLMAGVWWVVRSEAAAAWRLKWSFNRALAKEMARFGLLVGAASTAALLATQFDSFLVGTMVSETSLGFYERAYRIAQWPSLLLASVLTRTSFYTYAQLQDDLVRLKKSVQLTFWLVMALGLPFTLAIFASATDLVSFLWGERWLPSAILVQFLVIYSLLRPLLDNAGMLFVAVGQPRRMTVANSLQAAVLVAAAIPLTLKYGSIGTAAAVGAAFLVGGAVTVYYLRKTVALPLVETIFPPALAALATALAYQTFLQPAVLESLSVVIRIGIRSGFIFGCFWLVLLALQRRTFLERVAYVRRLVVGL